MIGKMKVIYLVLIFFLFQCFNVYADAKISNYQDYKITKKKFDLTEISAGFNYPWGMTFIDDVNLLITEKKGKLFKFNVNSKLKEEVNHNLKIVAIGQGGLLDVLYHDDHVYFSYRF